MRYWHDNGVAKEASGLAAAVDEVGHGTYMAGVVAAAGDNVPAYNGADPLDSIGVMMSGVSARWGWEEAGRHQTVQPHAADAAAYSLLAGAALTVLDGLL